MPSHEGVLPQTLLPLCWIFIEHLYFRATSWRNRQQASFQMLFFFFQQLCLILMTCFTNVKCSAVAILSPLCHFHTHIESHDCKKIALIPSRYHLVSVTESFVAKQFVVSSGYQSEISWGSKTEGVTTSDIEERIDILTKQIRKTDLCPHVSN